MKRRGLVSQGTVARLRKEAQMAWDNRNLTLCIDLLERANRLSPADPSILFQLGRMHGLRYDYEAAEQAFERGIKVAGEARRAEAFAAAGQQARDFYTKELAENYLEQAAQHPKATADALVKLAEVYERHRRLDEAKALAERALKQTPGFPAALLALGRLANRSGDPQEAEERLRPLLDLSVNSDVRVRAGYELGAVLDRQGRYDEAMSAFVGAKALLRHDAAPQYAHLKFVRGYLERMRTAISPEILQSYLEAGRDLQPAYRLALLGGHPRSGTTLLEQVLDSHPDIVSAEETNNFADYAYSPLQRRLPERTPFLEVLDSASSDRLGSLRQAYIEASELCLGTKLEGRLLIDKNPSLTFMIPAFVRIFPECDFLIALRDPRDVVLSCFMQPLLPVQQVSSAYLSLETTVLEYAALMRTWRTIAPMLKNPWLEVRYEDMVEDLESVARKTLDFLGVPWDERVLGFDEHARQKIVRSPTYSDVTQKVFKRARGRWRNYQKYLEPYLQMLEPFVKAFGYE